MPNKVQVADRALQPVQRLVTVALPFHPQFYTGDNHQTAGRRSEDDAQVLPFAGISFERIFRIGTSFGFAFGVIDLTFFKDLADLFFRDMTAVHAAMGVAGEDEAGGMAVDGVAGAIGGSLTSCYGEPEGQNGRRYPDYQPVE